MSGSDFVKVSAYASQAEQMLRASTAATIASNVVMAISIKLVWKMLAAIQLMVHMPLFAISHPPNATLTYSTMLNLVNFKFIKLDWLLD